MVARLRRSPQPFGSPAPLVVEHTFRWTSP
jgi:hypothetical protein